MKNLDQKYKEELRRFAIVNSSAQTVFLILIAIPMMITDKYVIPLSAAWIAASFFFLYLTTDQKVVDKIWFFFKRNKDEKI